MEFRNLDKKLQNAVEIAKSLALENGNAKYTPAHLLKAMLNKEFDLAKFLPDVAYLEEWAEIRIEECEKVSGVVDVEADERIAKV